MTAGNLFVERKGILMNKDVLVSIKGLHMDVTQGEEELETIVRGEYKQKNNAHYIEYDEFTQDSEALSRTSLYIDRDRFEMLRDGEMNMALCFEKNRKSMTGYNTPFGNFMLGVTTNEYELEESAGKIKLNIDYSLEVNYMFVGDCKVSLDVESV